MLRAAAALVVAIASSVTLLPSTAQAGDGGPAQVKGNNDGVVSTTVEDPGQSGASSTDTTTVSDVHSSCVWMQVFTFEQLPLPPKVARQSGGWWQQYCNGNGWAGMPVFVPDGSTPAAVLQTSPATLAQRAVNQLRLPAPTAGLNPTPRALVNLAEWFWVPRSDWTTLTQRTQAGAVWAAVVARPTSTTWDPGDGSAPFTCAGAGTPYVKDEPASAQHSDCTYTYRRSSANEPQSGPDPNDRFFTATVTTTWSVSWTGAGGTGGALPQMTRTSTFRLAVAERDAVVTGGSG